MKRFSCFILLAVVSCLPVTAFSQEVRFVAPTRYTQNNGLSSYYITRIVRDSYGFLWIGTQEGLNVFDGNRFQVFSRQSQEKHRLGGSLVSDLVEDKKRNWLWVLMSYNDLCAIDLQTRVIRKRIPLDRHNPDAVKWNRCLAIQGDTLLIGGLDFIAAYHIEEDRYLPIDIRQKSSLSEGECNVARICFDDQRRMIIFSDGYGIVVLDRNFNLLQVIRDTPSHDKAANRKLRFWDAVSMGGKLFAASSHGLKIFTNNAKLEQVPGPLHPIAAFSDIQSLALASDSSVLFSTPEGFYQYDLHTSKIISWRDENIEDDWFTITRQTYFDPATQRAWIGTQAGLATFPVNNNSFHAFTRSSTGSTRIKHLYALLPVPSNTVYCGDENGLYHVDTRIKEITKIDTASSNLMLFRDAAQNIFVSNAQGFRLIDGKTVKPAKSEFPELKPLDADLLSCGLQYNDSLVLFGSIIQRGLTVWNTIRRTLSVYHQDSLRHPMKGLTIINYLYKSRSGEVLILTEKSIIAFNPLTGAYVTHTIRNNASQEVISNFMDACETSEHYWIATYGDGLVRIDKNFRVRAIISSENGLNNNCVYRVFPYQDKTILATTNRGLSVIDIEPFRIKNYFKTDGLHADEFEQLCGYQDGRRVWAGGVNGFTVIDPSALPRNTRAPDLYFHHVKVNTSAGVRDTTHIRQQEMVISSDVLQTTITFSALNYANPAAVTYAYKIDELNSDWISLGRQNFVDLIGLSPGDYTLHIRASNEDGVWNETPLTLQLTYLPQWFQTSTFKISVLLTGALLIYGLLRYRIAQLKKQQQIRKEIGNDLHDDIGSTLNTLKIFTHLAKRDPGNKNHLDQIEESITQATMSLRDMIWVLEDSEDSIFELMERIKKFALPVCVANGIRFESSIVSEKKTWPLLKTEKRNLLLIAKETINNSIKYARCSNISAQLVQTRHELRLVITDDGIGFSPGNVVQGKGLESIRYRAGQILFNCEITSSRADGTSVELCRIKKPRLIHVKV